MDRLKPIDILRAVAVFLVLGRHMEICPPETSAILNRVTTVWARGGWIGVDLFFVLSGFLVSGLLFREYERFRELRIGHFLVRRGLKIYPPFWLLMGVTVMTYLLRHRPLPWGAVASELLFVQNYLAGMWNHTWSLAVEEHFYLSLALGLYLLAKWRPNRPFGMIPGIFVAIALGCLLLRINTAGHAAYAQRIHLFPSHLRLDGLFFGVVLSYAYHSNPSRFLAVAGRFRHLLASIGVLLLLPAFWFPIEKTPFLYTYGFTLFYLGSGSLLAAALASRSPKGRLSGAVAYAGSHSYSVYLWHMPVGHWGAESIGRLAPQQYGWFVYAATYLVGAVAFGIGMSLLTEFPVLRLRDRLFPSRGTPLSPASTKPEHSLEQPCPGCR